MSNQPIVYEILNEMATDTTTDVNARIIFTASELLEQIETAIKQATHYVRSGNTPGSYVDQDELKANINHLFKVEPRREPAEKE